MLNLNCRPRPRSETIGEQAERQQRPDSHTLACGVCERHDRRITRGSEQKRNKLPLTDRRINQISTGASNVGQPRREF